MSFTFTTQIEVPAGDGWQAIAPSETVTPETWGVGWTPTAVEVARAVEYEQTEADGEFRVLVWTGTDVTANPALVHHVGSVCAESGDRHAVYTDGSVCRCETVPPGSTS